MKTEMPVACVKASKKIKIVTAEFPFKGRSMAEVMQSENRRPWPPFPKNPGQWPENIWFGGGGNAA